MIDLVICFTPLQAVLIESLRKNNILDDFDVLYCVPRPTEQYLHYFSRLRDISKECIFFDVNKRFPSYVFSLKRIFKGRVYRNVFFANVDNIYIHFILSLVSFDKVFTFDDGTANIITSSSFYEDRLPLSKKILYRLFGRNFDLSKTKSIIDKHYTIYKEFSNLIENTEHLSLNLPFEDKYNNYTESMSNINVFLGSVFNDLTDEPHALVSRIEAFISGLDGDVYYIPHPREFGLFFKNLKRLDGFEIAEEKIIKLLITAERINLYGFNSSAQINLKDVQGINNFFLTCELVNVDFRVDYDCSVIEI
ncbi:glycosyltransferase family 52 [Aeromonas caviae]